MKIECKVRIEIYPKTYLNFELKNINMIFLKNIDFDTYSDK